MSVKRNHFFVEFLYKCCVSKQKQKTTSVKKKKKGETKENRKATMRNIFSDFIAFQVLMPSFREFYQFWRVRKLKSEKISGFKFFSSLRSTFANVHTMYVNIHTIVIFSLRFQLIENKKPACSKGVGGEVEPCRMNERIAMSGGLPVQKGKGIGSVGSLCKFQ